jgi:hypothetical protein
VDVGDEHHPLVVVEVEGENLLQNGEQLLQRDRGEKPERPEVHPQDRLPGSAHHPRGGKERAVPAENDEEVAFLRNLGTDDGLAAANQRGGLPVEDHSPAVCGQPVAKVGNDLFRPGVGVLGNDPGALHRGLG